MGFMRFLVQPATLSAIIHILVVAALLVRVIMTRRSTGVALAWLVLISTIPLFGALLYLMIGERRIGRDRARGIGMLRTQGRKVVESAVKAGMLDVNWSKHDPAVRGMSRLGQTMVGSPTVRGSSLELFSDTNQIMDAIRRDIDSAKTSVLMEFYIWSEGGKADEILDAMIRASERGVMCRILIDALGARSWWKGKQPKRLRDAGVEVRPALPVGIMRTFIGRTDLRLHRKIVVIDGHIAWTGSMNLVDPAFFKQDAGVGQWVDAMTRVRGSVVVPMGMTWIGDWSLETGESIEDLATAASLHLTSPQGNADIQVIPSGPGETGDGLLQMILGLIHAARDEVILTTPYLVPDDSLLRALRGAAASGVDISLIVPENVDSFLTRYASRSYFSDLLDVGVKIFLFRDGLLHTKSITVDGKMSMFGTVNLDMRSLWLNYEVAMFVYDADFAKRLRDLQLSYRDRSHQLDNKKWSARPVGTRFLEDALRLMSPLL